MPHPVYFSVLFSFSRKWFIFLELSHVILNSHVFFSGGPHGSGCFYTTFILSVSTTRGNAAAAAAAAAAATANGWQWRRITAFRWALSTISWAASDVSRCPCDAALTTPLALTRHASVSAPLMTTHDKATLRRTEMSCDLYSQWTYHCMIA